MAQDIKSRGPKGKSSSENNKRYSSLISKVVKGKIPKHKGVTFFTGDDAKTPLQAFTKGIDVLRNKFKEAKMELVDYNQNKIVAPAKKAALEKRVADRKKKLDDAVKKKATITAKKIKRK
tara:strand:- start:351 stop:710 length:360 start_codon:yes stop_codon:yes gene_type:complete